MIWWLEWPPHWLIPGRQNHSNFLFHLEKESVWVHLHCTERYLFVMSQVKDLKIMFPLSTSLVTSSYPSLKTRRFSVDHYWWFHFYLVVPKPKSKVFMMIMALHYKVFAGKDSPNQLFHKNAWLHLFYLRARRSAFELSN
jgi:hypothetical protein